MDIFEQGFCTVCPRSLVPQFPKAYIIIQTNKIIHYLALTCAERGFRISKTSAIVRTNLGRVWDCQGLGELIHDKKNGVKPLETVPLGHTIYGKIN